MSAGGQGVPGARARRLLFGVAYWSAVVVVSLVVVVGLLLLLEARDAPQVPDGRAPAGGRG